MSLRQSPGRPCLSQRVQSVQGLAESVPFTFSVFLEVNDAVSCSNAAFTDAKQARDCKPSSAAGCLIWDKPLSLSDTLRLPLKTRSGHVVNGKHLQNALHHRSLADVETPPFCPPSVPGPFGNDTQCGSVWGSSELGLASCRSRDFPSLPTQWDGCSVSLAARCRV